MTDKLDKLVDQLCKLAISMGKPVIRVNLIGGTDCETFKSVSDRYYAARVNNLYSHNLVSKKRKIRYLGEFNDYKHFVRPAKNKVYQLD